MQGNVGINTLIGPPGAGKTLFGSALATRKADEGKRGLMVAFGNSAANEFARALVAILGPERAREVAVRTGYEEGVGQNLPIDFSVDAAVLAKKEIIIDTTMSISRLPPSLSFDYTVVDEAGIERLDHLLWPMAKVVKPEALLGRPFMGEDLYDLLCSAGADATVVGDPKQGRPYGTNRWEPSAIQWLMNRSKRYETLRLTHRLRDPIDRLVDEFAEYGGLRASAEAAQRRLEVTNAPDPAFRSLLDPDVPVKLVDVHSSTEVMAGRQSFYNDTEARLVTRIAQQITRSCPTSSVSVVTVYAHQREVIRGYLYDCGLHDVRVMSTKEALGSEADATISSIVRNNADHVIGASGGLPEENVSISRGKKMSVVVGSLDMMYKGIYYLPSDQMRYRPGAPSRKLAWLIDHKYGTVLDPPRMT
ncbi:MAG: hypothetical protein KGI38_05995 [Thaumarchaeota archaeon]|nr:hypothetical protein [Nitrososphaerota archaeon]